jgi:metal-responsive CopG/Arc/MetJ family transcriptional regulator
MKKFVRHANGDGRIKISFRLPKQAVKSIDEISKDNGVSRSHLLRQMLFKGYDAMVKEEKRAQQF